MFQEKAMALKIGRQKKIQIIDGQQVEVLTGDDEEDEEEEDPDQEMPLEGQKMMAVEGQDGQQYVVLEVIQLPENQDQDIKPKLSPIKEHHLGSSPPAKKIKTDSNEKKQADLASAFGFDDDDEEDEDE